jgi:hypothetical protein
VALDAGAPAKAAGDMTWTYATGDGPVKGLVWPEVGTTRVFLSTTNTVWGLEHGSDTPLFSRAIPSPSAPLLAKDGSDLYLYVGGGDGSLYELDLNNPPSNPSQKTLQLGDGGAAIGAPSLDVSTGLLHVGSEAGIIYAVAVPLP